MGWSKGIGPRKEKELVVKHLLLGLALAFGLMLALPASDADARKWGGGGSYSYSASSASGGGHSVPELDTTLAGSAIVLLLGGVAYLASRRRDDAGL